MLSVDIHCDLLAYLAESKEHSVNDPVVRCSAPDLIKGNVCLQTLAIFCMTQSGSSEEGKKQVNCFLNLLKTDPLRFSKVKSPLSLKPALVQVIAAFENAACFAEETESFDLIIERLESYIQQIGPIFYISLTWNGENRFGGGCGSSIGLKEDGKKLLDYLNNKRIALDISHASDKLAYDLIDWIDRRGLNIPVIASHSNFRALSNYERNLPDDLAKEIIRRKGLIGLNFFAPFIHPTDPSVLLHHVEYGLSLGGDKSLCFGADFFFSNSASLQVLKQKYQREEFYYKELSNASVYPALLQAFQEKLKLDTTLLQQIAFQNVLSFLKDNILPT